MEVLKETKNRATIQSCDSTPGHESGEKYGLKDYKKFYWELRRNSLYFLGKEKKSYNKYVRGLIEN